MTQPPFREDPYLRSATARVAAFTDEGGICIAESVFASPAVVRQTTATGSTRVRWGIRLAPHSRRRRSWRCCASS